MGISCGKSLPAETQENRKIEKYLREENAHYRSELKLLLLGAGESGKSTIAKQMQILHNSGFSQQERLDYVSTITHNILSALRVLIQGGDSNWCTLSPVIQKIADEFVSKFCEREIANTSHISKDDAQKIQLLWSDPSIKAVYQQHAARLQLFSSAQYFLDSLERILQSDYLPSDQDILHARRPTTGIQIIDFTVDGVDFKCVDVGGQRSERRKWLHVFDDVSAVLFCAALDEYNMRLLEDDTIWRVHESLKLFGEIVNSTHLANSGMILFLNKKDLFLEKIKHVDLIDSFPSYTGGKNYDNAVKYIEKQFLKEAKTPDRVYVHVTVATDTENIQFVFNAVKDTLINQMLAVSGV